jgi:quinol monooxygenase YgiN
VVVEKWETLAHLQAHAVAPHMKAHSEKTKEFIESKLIHVLEPV